jgi:uroporphyrinogen decarboxylase
MIELPERLRCQQSGSILSPAMFRKFIQPCLERLVKVIKEHNPDIKIMLHSDGAIATLLPDLIALGVDVIHPLEPLPATDLAAIKAKYGKQVSFLGGIDITHAMPGSRQAVVAEVKQRIAQLASGGGYILLHPITCRLMCRLRMWSRCLRLPGSSAPTTFSQIHSDEARRPARYEYSQTHT